MTNKYLASGDSFCQYGCVHVFVVELPVFQRYISSSALCIKLIVFIHRYVVKAIAVLLKSEEIRLCKKCE